MKYCLSCTVGGGAIVNLMDDGLVNIDEKRKHPIHTPLIANSPPTSDRSHHLSHLKPIPRPTINLPFKDFTSITYPPKNKEQVFSSLSTTPLTSPSLVVKGNVTSTVLSNISVVQTPYGKHTTVPKIIENHHILLQHNDKIDDLFHTISPTMKSGKSDDHHHHNRDRNGDRDGDRNGDDNRHGELHRHHTRISANDISIKNIIINNTEMDISDIFQQQLEGLQSAKSIGIADVSNDTSVDINSSNTKTNINDSSTNINGSSTNINGSSTNFNGSSTNDKSNNNFNNVNIELKKRSAHSITIFWDSTFELQQDISKLSIKPIYELRIHCMETNRNHRRGYIRCTSRKNSSKVSSIKENCILQNPVDTVLHNQHSIKLSSSEVGVRYKPPPILGNVKIDKNDNSALNSNGDYFDDDTPGLSLITHDNLITIEKLQSNTVYEFKCRYVRTYVHNSDCFE